MRLFCCVFGHDTSLALPAGNGQRTRLCWCMAGVEILIVYKGNKKNTFSDILTSFKPL